MSRISLFESVYRSVSYYVETKDKNAPTISERIANAEIIEGLPFESLEHVLYYKRKMGRPKDKQDIEILEVLISKKQTKIDR